MLLACLELVCEFPCTVSACLLTVVLLCAWSRSCQVPVLICGDAFGEFLFQYCPLVSERFCPTPWCWEGRQQTIVSAFLKSGPAIDYRNELIRTADGGQISLDWVDNRDSAAYPESSTRPTVLILPGLTGSSKQPYSLLAVSQATQRGYRCVVFNNRGCGREELLTPVTFCAANISDLEVVVLHIRSLYPEAPVLGAGVSLGGMVLLNYLASKGTESGLVAAITLSVCWDAEKSSVSMEKPLNWLFFNVYLTAALRRLISRHRKMLEKVADVDFLLKCRSIRQFDERFTAVQFGYKSCAEYYHDASPDHKLPRIAVPILCLNSADDPLSPKNALPVALARSLPNVALLVTAHGGHIAFLQGLFPRSEGYMERLFGQFIHAVFEHTEDLEACCGVAQSEQ